MDVSAPVSTLETVLSATPASSATSRIVGGFTARISVFMGFVSSNA
jgi:hypothetical protein